MFFKFLLNKRLCIFLNRKLISYDHILPFLYELKYFYPETKLEIWFPDKITFDEIKKNIFIYDIGEKIATFKVISSAHLSGLNRYINKFYISLILLQRIIITLFLKTTFIHFKLLDFRPFNILKMINYKNTYLAENDSYGYTQVLNDINYLKFTPIKKNIKNKNFLQFSDEWLEIDKAKSESNNVLNFGTPKMRKLWIDNVIKESDKYIDSELSKYNLSNSCLVISIMLGYFGGLVHQTSDNVQKELLTKTLQVLSNLDKEVIVMLKPHIITDMQVLYDIIKMYPNLNIHITYLHPMVLATRSKFVIVNDYSTSINDFKIMGVKTIEYASYNDAGLKITKGKSQGPKFVDYFINKDEKLFEKTVNNLIENKYETNILYNSDDKHKIFKKILCK